MGLIPSYKGKVRVEVLHPFQTLTKPRPDRKDHIWVYTPSLEAYKCCLCGGIDKSPPAYPTPPDYTPSKYQLPLSQEERELCAYRQ